MSAAFHLFADRLEKSLKQRYEQCPQHAGPDTVLLAVLNAVADARAVTPLTPPTFQDAIKQAREARGLSLAEVADAAKISKGHMWELERGHQKNPSLDTMRKLNGVLGLKPEDWFR